MTYQCLVLGGNWQLAPHREQLKTDPHEVPVPGLVDCAQPPISWQEHDFIWYKTSFECPQIAQNQHVFLQLEQVQFGAQVWLNGQLIGEDIPCYTSQWYDLTTHLNDNNQNILLVRVGQKHTLPEHSAVGNDQEKLAWIPGIWGEVKLHIYGAGRIPWMRIIPDINTGKIHVTTEIEKLSDKTSNFQLQLRIREKSSGRYLAESRNADVTLQGAEIVESHFEIKIPDFQLWTLENPFLYDLEASLRHSAGTLSHKKSVPFGMRAFEIKDGHFYLNGERKVLLGSNIAFHRLLADKQRGNLPWDEAWIKRALVEIPKENNLFFFRIHIGHACNKWYDFADEHGILLEDEWAFWPSSGSKEQTELEFRAWIRENGHHPSIVIWNALNESSDAAITEEIIPRMKKLDPTRPWQHIDFNEDHPYIYSLGPVLNGNKFGYSRSIFELEKSETPSMVNEYKWWWLDYAGNPSQLTEMVAERWLGRQPSREQLLQHQVFLTRELGELWRRLDLDAIMPFVYLSAGEGATANWFFDPLEELKPKPVLQALKNTFSPLGLSIELWDRHFLAGEKRDLRLFLFNDSDQAETVHLQLFFDGHPENIIFEENFQLHRGEHKILPVAVPFPTRIGTYQLCAQLSDEQQQFIADSLKIVHVIASNRTPAGASFPTLAIADPDSEISDYLNAKKLPFVEFPAESENWETVLLVGEGVWKIEKRTREKLTKFVASGGTLIVQEPELGVTLEKHLRLLDDLKIKLEFREEKEMGGYDSYIFIEDPAHELWHGIAPEYLKLFNGALGGEIVSQHHVLPNRDFITHARCGLSLCIPAVMEVKYGKGRVLISRLQMRGRLLDTNSGKGLYERRFDPVAERYFHNLLRWSRGK